MAFWASVMLLSGALLLGRHLLALPRPSPGDDVLARSMATLRGPNDADRWMLVHVLYGECRCSQRIIEHLLSTERPANVSEKVLLVDGNEVLAERLSSRGFVVSPVTMKELGERYHVSGVPLFVVVAPNGEVRYSGGYTARKQGPDAVDLEVLARLQADRPVTSLPVFGCAISQRIRKALSPWSIQ